MTIYMHSCLVALGVQHALAYMVSLSVIVSCRGNVDAADCGSMFNTVPAFL